MRSRGAHHVELLVVRPLVMVRGLHGVCIRGGLISCWSGQAEIRALSRQLWAVELRMSVSKTGVGSEVDEYVSRAREEDGGSVGEGVVRGASS